jgi:hypothetical protein
VKSESQDSVDKSCDFHYLKLKASNSGMRDQIIKEDFLMGLWRLVGVLSFLYFAILKNEELNFLNFCAPKLLSFSNLGSVIKLQ